MFPTPSYITIGKQTWMTSNLDIQTFRNGEEIPHIIDNADWENAGAEGKAACCYYNHELDARNGLLYNRFAFLDDRGLIPDGWRLPTCADWDELINYLGGSKVAGKKLKTIENWHHKENGLISGTNEVGFNAYPSGQRDFMGKFNWLNLGCGWWAAPEGDYENIWFYYLDYNIDDIQKAIADPEDGFSIRLIKI